MAKDFEDILKKTFKDIEKLLASKEMICAFYLYKFINDKDRKEYLFNRFLELFKTLSADKQRLVFVYYNNINKNNDKNKTYVKKKGNDKYE